MPVFAEEAELDHPTFADRAFLAFLDKRMSERFPMPSEIVGEDIPQAIAEDFRAWLADPATRAVHHPGELRELQELMAIEWEIVATPPVVDETGTPVSAREFASRFHPDTVERAAQLSNQSRPPSRRTNRRH
jgi:hypothetical protein